MKIITVSNQKGGVGKTATVVNLAGYLVKEHHQKVMVIDLDTQGNASWSLSSYDTGLNASEILFNNTREENLNINNAFDEYSEKYFANDISLVKADAVLANIDTFDINLIVTNLAQFFKKAEEAKIDIVLVDTPPSLGKALTGSLLVSDYVICPIELEAYSLQGVSKLQNVITNIRKYNQNLQVLGLLPSMVDGRNRRHKKQLSLISETYPNLVISHSIGLRCSIADALSEKQFLGDVKNNNAKKAKQEFSELTNWLFNRVFEKNTINA